MSIDPNPPSATIEPQPTPVIENEIPAYRAISGAAVSSMVLGLTSLLCFADLRFLGVAAVALALGVAARRKIHRMPDVLTGKGMADAGIALALVFAVSSVTVSFASDALQNYQAGQFARRYVGVLKDEPLAVAVWYQQPIAYRKIKKPDEVLEELQKAKAPAPGKSDPYTERTASIRLLKERLKGKGEEIRYSKVESKYVDGLTQYINALVEVDGPGRPEFPEKEQFALLELVKGAGGASDWMVKQVRFPYKPASALATPVHKDDDGHGH